MVLKQIDAIKIGTAGPASSATKNDQATACRTTDQPQDPVRFLLSRNGSRVYSTGSRMAPASAPRVRVHVHARPTVLVWGQPIIKCRERPRDRACPLGKTGSPTTNSALLLSILRGERATLGWTPGRALRNTSARRPSSMKALCIQAGATLFCIKQRGTDSAPSLPGASSHLPQEAYPLMLPKRMPYKI